LQIRVADDGTVAIRTVAGQRARVTVPDLEAGSSVVHVINEVLLPFPQETPAAPTEAPKPDATPAAPTPAAADACVYIVKEGDILFDIAATVNSTVAQLQELNPSIQDPELILPGQELKLC
jgi:LysM repeat protein